MFERFLAKFGDAEPEVVPDRTNNLADWLEIAGGRTFGGGVYRVHSTMSAQAANALVGAAYPDYSQRISCFGFDWLGRQFATILATGGNTDPEVLMFEPGTGEVLQGGVPFSTFHDQELVDFADDVLATNFFSEWVTSGGQRPAFDECVGYRVPLYLGGKDVIANLEISDMDVYWTLMGQLRRTRSLPIGSRIAQVGEDPAAY